MADKRHIIHAHIERVTGTTQSDINTQLKDFFIDVPKDDILFDVQEELNKGILVVNNDVEDPSIYIKDNKGDIVKISGNGSKDVNTYVDALAEATSKNIGQIFYVKEETVLEDGTTYSVGPYIVIGEGEMMKLSASSPSGDIDADVAKLRVDVKNINNELININNEFSNVNTLLDSKVDLEEGYSLISNIEKEKLSEIEEKAQVNRIENIVINGANVPISDKTAFIPELESDGRLEKVEIIEENGAKYLKFSFTESAGNVEPIKVDISELFTEQYVSGKGITIEDLTITLKLGNDENNLSFDENGGLIIREKFIKRIDDIETNVSNVNTFVGDLSGNVETIKTDINNVGTLINDLSGNVETIKTDVNNAGSLINDLSGNVETIKTDVNNVNTFVGDLSGNVETIKTDVNKVKIINAIDYASGVQQATKDNVGQIIRIYADSVFEGINYLKGYYFVEGEGVLSFIMLSDGSQNEIEVLEQEILTLKEKDLLIDTYSINNHIISEENGIVLNGEDIQLSETFPDVSYTLDMVKTGDTIDNAIRKVENSLAATVIALTASLNDMNLQINWVVDNEMQPIDGVLDLNSNTLHVVNEPVSIITLNAEEGYGYAVLLKTADIVESIVLPQNIILSNLTIEELESNTNYLLELKYNFARWTKLKTL
jgi:outer membrane murein-binding lipoprotein Lpp